MHKDDELTKLFDRSETESALKPESHIWERLDAKLTSDEKEVKIIRQRYWLSAAAVALLVVATLGFWQQRQGLYITDLSAPYVTHELIQDQDYDRPYLSDIKMMNGLLPLKPNFPSL